MRSDKNSTAAGLKNLGKFNSASAAKQAAKTSESALDAFRNRIAEKATAASIAGMKILKGQDPKSDAPVTESIDEAGPQWRKDKSGVHTMKTPHGTYQFSHFEGGGDKVYGTYISSTPGKRKSEITFNNADHAKQFTAKHHNKMMKKLGNASESSGVDEWDELAEKVTAASIAGMKILKGQDPKSDKPVTESKQIAPALQTRNTTTGTMLGSILMEALKNPGHFVQ